MRKNALINGSSDDYRISWLGDSASTYTTTGNVEALDVLNAASEIAPVYVVCTMNYNYPVD